MEGIVSRPGDGEFLEGEDRELRVKLSRDELDVLEFEVGPEYEGPGPHFHKEHVDSFYVLEGELEFTVEGNTIRAPARTYVAAPPGVVHSFTNPGPGHARLASHDHSALDAGGCATEAPNHEGLAKPSRVESQQDVRAGQRA